MLVDSALKKTKLINELDIYGRWACTKKESQYEDGVFVALHKKISCLYRCFERISQKQNSLFYLSLAYLTTFQ
jgi:hypothetical protein